LDTQRFVLLNRLISRSKTRARLYTAPTHDAAELLEIVSKRHAKGWAIEFEHLKEGDDAIDEDLRITQGQGHNFLRLRQLKWEGNPQESRYVTLLLEHIDQNVRSFPVVHTTTYQGREIQGEEEERGATAAHVVILLPPESALNTGMYRCAIEAVSSISRTAIERFLCRQLRRDAVQAGGWTFSVTETGRHRRPVTKEFKYTPRLELVADVGRSLGGGLLTDGRTLTSMVFTKRKERHAIGHPTAITHEDVVADLGYRVRGKTEIDQPMEEEVFADVECKINANQGPKEPDTQRSWVSAVRKHFEDRGYETRLYFRNVAGGGVFSGEIHPAIAGASDLLICPKEIISLAKLARLWQPDIDPETVEKMKEILNTDAVWQHVE
jgi:hypothetical protein